MTWLPNNLPAPVTEGHTEVFLSGELVDGCSGGQHENICRWTASLLCPLLRSIRNNVNMRAPCSSSHNDLWEVIWHHHLVRVWSELLAVKTKVHPRSHLSFENVLLHSCHASPCIKHHLNILQDGTAASSWRCACLSVCAPSELLGCSNFACRDTHLLETFPTCKHRLSFFFFAFTPIYLSASSRPSFPLVPSLVRRMGY